MIEPKPELPRQVVGGPGTHQATGCGIGPLRPRRKHPTK
jgi:hypothetical protein